MDSVALNLNSLHHAVFLSRATALPATSSEARHGQGAFLVLRLVDLLAPERAPVAADAFHYQWAATDRYCRELQPETTEAAHLRGLGESAAEAQRRGDPGLLAPALVAYAHHLENEARFEEALDVLHTLIRVGGERLKHSDAIAGTLRIGRVNRKLAQFDAAEAAYADAARRAATTGDGYSVLLSRLGRAETLRGRGNLSEAERALREILTDAQASDSRDAEARAEHHLSAALGARGNILEALTRAWRAFGLYEDEASRLRALSDVGIMLRALGDLDAAEQAFTQVARRSSGYDQDTNAVIELLECASRRGDRLAFGRWREQCVLREPRMGPNMRVDFYLKLGIGQARFGQFHRAEASLEKALELSAEAGLHEFEFRIERIKGGLRDCERELSKSPLEVAEPLRDEALQDLRLSLSELAKADA